MNYVYIATSLDGFVAKSDGSLDWLENLGDPNDDYGFADFLEKIDALIMGRNTFESVVDFEVWPFDKPVFVLSTTMEELPEKLLGKVEILNGEPKNIINHLNQRGFENFYIDGSQTIQRFLMVDLIDEMIITSASILLGEGIPLFHRLTGDKKFKCVNVEILNPYMVKHYYVKE